MMASIVGQQSAPSSHRIRFASVPNTLEIITDQQEENDNNLQQQRKKDFWRHLDDGGRRLRLKSKEIVVTYAPVQWQPLLLDTVELTFQHLEKMFNFIHRRMSTSTNYSYSTTPTTNNSILQPLQTTISQTSTFQTVLFGCLMVACCFIAYSYVLKIILHFLLPFYACFNGAYWFFQWRRHYDVANCSTSTTSNTTTTTSCSHEDEGKITNDVVKLLYFCCLVDLTIIIFVVFAIDSSSSSSSSSYAQISILHVLPLISFLTAKCVTSYVETATTSSSTTITSASSATTLTIASSPSSEDVIITSFNNYYFAAFFAVRLFAYKGLVAVPWYVRSYLAYLSIYLALKSVENNYGAAATQRRQTKLENHHAANSNKGTAASLFCSQCASSASTVAHHHQHHCNNYSTSSSADVVVRSPTSVVGGSQSPMYPPSAKQQFKLLTPLSADGGNTAEFYHGMKHQNQIRPSRRVSLPAGSLMPVKTQNNLGEARGLIAELLSQKDLPPHIVTGLKALINLLNPQTVPTVSDLLANLPSVLETPFIGEQLTLVAKHLEDGTSDSPLSVEAPANFKEQLCQKTSVESTDSLLQTPDGTLFDIDELEHDDMLSNMRQWSLLIFDLHAASQNTLLSRVAYSVFRQSRLFNIFKIPRQKFFNFFHALEQGYWHIPYHNSIHASDVMHAAFYFASNQIPALGDNVDGLSSVLSSLEVMALLTASGMHDYDHPGRTNAYLVATGDSKAILYNDRSVLENHHAASAWKLLSLPQNNFIENLDSAEYKRFRFIIMEAILATDLKRHFEILMEFNEKVNSRGLDWENEADKLLVTQICIKMADINSPTKPFDLHIQWTNRILDEFYAQGDAERERGLPVSAYMDRNEPQVAKLQDSFIAHLVKPLVQAMHTARLLPLRCSSSSMTSSSCSREQDDDEDAADEPAASELIVNIEENHIYWKQQLDESSSPLIDLNLTQIEFDNDHDSSGEMETIEEDDDENT